MDLSRNPLWDERGEFRRGCTVGEALSWLTASGSHSAGESVYINGELYKIGRLLYGPDRHAVADKPIARVCDGYYHRLTSGYKEGRRRPSLFQRIAIPWSSWSSGLCPIAIFFSRILRRSLLSTKLIPGRAGGASSRKILLM